MTTLPTIPVIVFSDYETPASPLIGFVELQGRIAVAVFR
jgi:hypothetical protein